MEQENQVAEEYSRHNDIVPTGRLKEIRFWVHNIIDHALFIALGLPCDQTKLIAEAQSFVQQFKELEEKVKNAKIIDPWLLEKIRSAVRALIAFQLGLLALMLQCKIRPAIFPLFIDHITREAVHFLELLEKPQQPLSSIEQMLRRAVFWLRQMKEQIEFISHLRDPSERLLINQA